VSTALNIAAVKYDPAEQHIWSRRFGDGSQLAFPRIATDASTKEVIIAGENSRVVDFGCGPLIAAGKNEVVVGKFAP
jgi:hypothetical protein